MRLKLSRRQVFVKTGLALSGTVAASSATCRTLAPFVAPSVAEMVGQLLICGLPAKSAADESAQLFARQLAEGKVGGSVLLRHNVKDRESVLSLTELFVSANPRVLNAIDQEGGLVQRMSEAVGFSKLPRAHWVAKHLSHGQAAELYFEAGEELRRAGFNLNLAPSVDWHDPENPVIGKFGRSFGGGLKAIEAYATSFVDGMQRAGLAATLKHFPGHGTSRGDSHNGFVDISTTWSAEELLPFERLASRAQLVMGGHLFHPRFSDGELPITFSSRALQGELRAQMGFAGVIVTDDLDMGAIRKSYSLEDAVVRALQAGNDLLLLSNSLDYDPDLPDRAVEWVARALVDERLSLDRLVDAYHRVVQLKNRYAFATPSFSYKWFDY